MPRQAFRLLIRVAGICLLVGGLLVAQHRQNQDVTMAGAASTSGRAGAGCGHAWQSGVDSHGTLPFGGLQRTYLLHVPPAYSPQTPWPLILNLHGLAANADLQAGLSLMSPAADRLHVLVVYPSGTGNPARWNVGLAGPAHGVDDVGYLSALVGALEGELCVDTARVAVTGISDGAIMVYYLACIGVTWLSAVAPVAGYRPLPQARCRLARPLPLIAFNGQRDTLVPYNGLPHVLPSSPQTVKEWALAVGCPMPDRTGFAEGDVVETVYGPCPHDVEVRLYTITDGGHTWPGGFPVPPFGKTTQVISASSLILSFMQAHPM